MFLNSWLDDLFVCSSNWNPGTKYTPGHHFFFQIRTFTLDIIVLIQRMDECHLPRIYLDCNIYMALKQFQLSILNRFKFSHIPIKLKYVHKNNRKPTSKWIWLYISRFWKIFLIYCPETIVRLENSKYVCLKIQKFKTKNIFCCYVKILWKYVNTT